MGFSSQDDLITEITVNGKFLSRDYVKSTAPVHTAGGWHLLTGLAGNPNAGTFLGTDLLYQSCWETSGDGTVVIGPQHAGVVTPDTKHILNVGAMMVAAAGAPWQAKLVDLQGYYRLSGTNVTGTGSRTLINANTFTASSSSGLLLTYTNDFNTLTKVRFTNSGGALPTGLTAGVDYYLVRVSATTARVATTLANAIAGTVIAFTDAGTGTHTLTIQQRAQDGVGCEAFFVVQTAPTGGGPNLTASDYTNQDGTTGRAFQGSPTNGAAADAYATRIIHSGNAAGRFGAFLPRQAADRGIARINSFTWSTGTAYTGTGVVALCIAKPLLDIALPVTGMWSERDLVNQLPSMPKVDDGACLAWLLFGTGATTNASPFTSRIDFGWG
jgi:hypothetical protein